MGWDRAQGCSVGWGQGREGSDGAGGKLGFDWGWAVTRKDWGAKEGGVFFERDAASSCQS